MRILAVGAHPDDLEILCAGTLARYVAQGHYVMMVHACRGGGGKSGLPRQICAEDSRRSRWQLPAESS